MFDFFRNLTKSEAEKRQEMLVAYLDDALTPQERTAFEEQLRSDSALQANLEQQRKIKQQISQLPRMQAPRNFTLDPALYGRPTSQRVYTLYPVIRAATALAAVVLIFLFAIDLSNTVNSRSETAAQVPNAPSNVANSEVSDAFAADTDQGDPAPQLEPAGEAEIAGGVAESVEEAAEDTAEEIVEEAEEVFEEVAEEEVMEEAPEEAMAGAEEMSGVDGEVVPEAEAEAEPAETGESAADAPPPEAFQPLPTSTETAASDPAISQSTTITQERAFNYLAVTTTPGQDMDTDFFSPTEEVTINNLRTDVIAEQPNDPIRILQISLGILLIILLATTWLLRRQL